MFRVELVCINDGSSRTAFCMLCCVVSGVMILIDQRLDGWNICPRPCSFDDVAMGRIKSSLLFYPIQLRTVAR